MKKLLTVLLGVVALTSGLSGETNLWKPSAPTAGWRAFGNGLLEGSAQGDAIKLAVDWEQTTFGIGAVFEAVSLGAGIRQVTVDARAGEADGTLLAPEWVAGERAFRVSTPRQPALTTEWETYTFDLPEDFPHLSGREDAVTALRLLFLNPQKPGRADVYFRNVRLLP